MGMEEQKKPQKASSSLIKKINKLQAAYQNAAQGLSEEEKEELKTTPLFDNLYEALMEYAEHVVDEVLYKETGLKKGELDTHKILLEICNALLGFDGKTARVETFQSKNNAEFTTACYEFVSKVTMRSYYKEKELVLDSLCLKKEELEEMRKWSLKAIMSRYVDIDENKDRIVERIRNNPQRSYEEQLYLKARIRELKKYMNIVAEGPEKKERSTSAKPVYRWVGGSVGAFLSPVMECEWQKMDWISDSAYRTASLIQGITYSVAISLAEETMGEKGNIRRIDLSKASKTERAVIKKFETQMKQELKPIQKKEKARIKKTGASRNEYGKLIQLYYRKLEGSYKAGVSSGSVFAPGWMWQVIHGLTPEEAAWLFAREMGACIPALKFDWKTSFKKRLKENDYTELYETHTTEKSTQVWPQKIRDEVVEIKRAREIDDMGTLLDDIKTAKETYENLLYNRIDHLLEMIEEEKDSIDDFRKSGKEATKLGDL